MKISMVAAYSENRVIGKDGKLPWNCPTDLERFKEITFGKTVVMGSKTHESIGRALPGRRNIVMTRSDKKFRGCETASSIEDVLEMCKGEREIMIIGGGDVYSQFLDKAHKLYISIIDGEYEGDTFFPKIDPYKWKAKSWVNCADHSFFILERKR